MMIMKDEEIKKRTKDKEAEKIMKEKEMKKEETMSMPEMIRDGGIEIKSISTFCESHSNKRMSSCKQPLLLHHPSNISNSCMSSLVNSNETPLT
jgi:hypothetical protein